MRIKNFMNFEFICFLINKRNNNQDLHSYQLLMNLIQFNYFWFLIFRFILGLMALYLFITLMDINLFIAFCKMASNLFINFCKNK